MNYFKDIFLLKSAPKLRHCISEVQINKNNSVDISFSPKKLPENFSDSLYNLEWKIDQGNGNITEINKIVEIYTVTDFRNDSKPSSIMNQ